MTSEARMYQKMYHILVVAAEMALTDIKSNNYGSVYECLEDALLEAEDVFISWEESEEAEIRQKKRFLELNHRLGMKPGMTIEEIEVLFGMGK